MSSPSSTLHSSQAVGDGNATLVPDQEDLSNRRSNASDAVYSDSSPRGIPFPPLSSPVVTTVGRLDPCEVTTGHDIYEVKAPALTPNSPIDLRMLDYVNACDENLICPICRCPFVDPVILTDCDHCFCRDCIRQTWANTPSNSLSPNRNRKDCPSCRTPAKLGLRSSTNKILTNILDDMTVRCPHAADGCAVQTKRAEVQDHISLYCGYTLIRCTADSCHLLSRRKDSSKGCLHVASCCMACRAEVQLADLETHWTSGCRDRKLSCEFCHSEISYRDLVRHREQVCPGVAVSCPGKSLGCPYESERARCDSHAKTCPLAALTPIFAAQKKRLDEQETAQKFMNRRMKVLENGLATMRDIMYPPMTTEGINDTSEVPPPSRFGLPVENAFRSPFDGQPATSAAQPQPTASRLDHPSDFDVYPGPDTSFPNSSPDWPYASPLHHLLSMHESLREEMSRISNALQELEGRQSLQILNENLRTREDMSYLGAQITGLTRQIHWLTSNQLQQQVRAGAPSTRSTGDIAAAGTSVEAAVSAMNTAVRGAARMVGVNREGMGSRRGSSEEGRTKL